MALILSAMRTLESHIVHYRFHKSPNGVYILRHAYLIFKNFGNIAISSRFFSGLQVFCCLQGGVRHSFALFVCALIITASRVEDDIESTFFSVALRPNAGHGLLILEVSRSHTTTHHSR
jgi:hypothetical protein